MENASEALIMAFSVLIFVLALSISISAFGQARATAGAIMDMSDSSFDYTYVPESGVETTKEGKTVAKTRRTVGSETIIPTLYRAYKENLVIIFQDNTESTSKKFNSKGIFAQKVNNQWNSEGTDNSDKMINNTIDLKSLNIGSEEKAIDFIRCLLYGYGSNETASTNLLYKSFNMGGSQLYKNLRTSEDDSLYNIIKDNKFEEFIGYYYEDDLQINPESNDDSSVSTSDDETKTSVSDVNKTRRRIIRYVLDN